MLSVVADDRLEEFLVALGAGENDFHPELTDFAARRHDVVCPRRRLDTECQIRSRTFDRTQPIKHKHVLYSLQLHMRPMYCSQNIVRRIATDQ